MTQDNRSHRVLDSVLAALGMNAGYVLDVYEDYRETPDGVSPEWKRYFAGLENGELSALDFPRSPAAGAGAPGRTTPAAPASPPPRMAPAAGSTPVLLGPLDQLEPLRGGAAVIVRNMEASREIPLASSYRSFPVKVMEENRRLINHHLDLSGRGRVSFTHILAWAVVQALKAHPRLNDCFTVVDGVPHRVRRGAIHLGLAVDLTRRDGSRALLVPNIRDVQEQDFGAFRESYASILERARTGRIQPEDFQGTTISLTNPGTVGTTSSVPRLMPGQGAIIATGAIDFPAENRAMSRAVLSELGVSRSMTISCTYDHRIIQGAESGEFLARVEELIRGEHEFYEGIFADLEMPYRPVRWMPDYNPSLGGMTGSRQHEAIIKEARVLQLINAYRVRGHLVADLDPLGATPQHHPELDPEFYGLTIWDLDRTFITGGLTGTSADENQAAPLREILETLRATYCGRIGVEYMNIQDPVQKRWLQDRMEPTRNQEPLEPSLKKRILEKLISSNVFEKFLHARFVGHKRFSLEGGETLIPILDQVLEEGAALGLREMVLGMAHRGRINVLTQVIGKDYGRVLREFQGNPERTITQGSGDVKYHLGARGVHESERGGPVAITLSPNPSHLEAVDPVVVGIARAKQERVGSGDARRRILPVLVHGDAAFAGQGVVAEVLNLSQLKGYRTGGTIHIVVNNQIGFTTSVEEARSTPYCTDVAKMSQAPIFHVNGDDPEAAVRVVRLALAFREEFQKDVVIDMFCYRRHGHNEGDEPSFTQPMMYTKIRGKPTVADIYAERLQREGILDGEEVEAMRSAAAARLDAEFSESAAGPVASGSSDSPEAPKTGPRVPRPTAVERTVLERITRAVTHAPSDVDVHPKLVKFLENRRAVMESGEGVDWAFAETLAFGSLVEEGVPVRLSGEDSARGTFSQRHLELHDDDTDVSFVGLQHVSDRQAPFQVIDSPLSEFAVLGFEYGYSLEDPRTLVLWEAQFGDFVNVAQVIIDQFLAGSQAKWGEPSGVVLLLPHGYEGQGPEHSSARMERFLQLCAEDNMQVVNCTTPAQYFHLLRRQMCEGVRRPLVIFTPKSMLRHPRAVSTVAELTDGAFRRVIPDLAAPDPSGVRRVVFSAGKVYYDLEKERGAASRQDVALVRVEQIYPFPETELRRELERYPGVEVVWVQEEPKNMGAWTFVAPRIDDLLTDGRRVRYVGRRESASTASGYIKVHLEEQKQLVNAALAVDG